MTDTTTVHNVQLENANGLTAIKRTYSGIAFGAVKPRAFLIDPDPRYVTSNTARNRAQSQSVAPLSSDEDPLGQFPNGSPAFVLEDALLVGEPLTKGSLNPSAWSVFTVVDGLGYNGITLRNYVTCCRVQRDDVVAPQLMLSSTATGTGNNEIIMYENTMREPGATRRVSVAANLESTGPNLIMWTFSVKNGCAIYLNGVRVAENTDDKRPLDFGYTAEELALFFGMRGTMGVTGGYNLDFNDPARAGDRRAIERYCAWQYDISDLKELYPERPWYFDLDL